MVVSCGDPRSLCTSSAPCVPRTVPAPSPSSAEVACTQRVEPPCPGSSGGASPAPAAGPALPPGHCPGLQLPSPLGGGPGSKASRVPASCLVEAQNVTQESFPQSLEDCSLAPRENVWVLEDGVGAGEKRDCLPCTPAAWLQHLPWAGHLACLGRGRGTPGDAAPD